MEDTSLKETDLHEFGTDDLGDDEEFLNEFTNDFFSQNVSYDGSHGSCNEPSAKHLEVLLKCFGHKKFRPLQWKIINSIINDKKDNCAIMATGYGKSLCFQYPSAFVGGLTLVISPLISLMEDQVLSLKMSNVPACLLGSAQSKQKEIIKEILEDKYSIIYLTPEFCTGDNGKDLLLQINSTLRITLIAVDEAHCVSSWGHDFRYSYRSLGMLKTIMPHVPILAVTATATPKVKDDIINVLQLSNPQVSYSGFDRPNLYFAVNLKGQTVFEDLKSLMVRQGQSWRFSGPTIIYCISRKDTEEISSILNGWDIKCLPYHAGLPLAVRTETHKKFVKDKIQVIVATIAFGMGIDKPDIRNVIHYGCSESIESYYQEVGRAGRDGLPSKCVTFYSNNDFGKRKLIQSKTTYNNLQQQRKDEMLECMQNYLSLRECRRKFILNYFGDKNGTTNSTYRNCCDNCSRNKEKPDTEIYEGLDEKGMYDFTKDATAFFDVVNVLKERFGIGTYVKFLRGSNMKSFEKFQNSPLFGSGKGESEAWWKAVGNLMQKEKLLEENKFSFQKQAFCGSTFRVSQKGSDLYINLKNGTTRFVVVPTPDIFKLLKRKPQPRSEWMSLGAAPVVESYVKASTSQINNVETGEEVVFRSKILRLLRNRRHELALEHDCMPYMIASDTALMQISKQRPIDINQLRAMKADGFTEAKLCKFGIDFVNIVRNECGIKESQEFPKLSIQDILRGNPLGDGKLNVSAQVSYKFLRKGLSIEEIVRERNYVTSTIINHLSDAMKIGYPIKLSTLGVTDKARDTIINVINKMEPDPTYSLAKIKDACPEEISYKELKPVVTYIMIREHLNRLAMPYEDFEDFTYSEINDQQESRPESRHDSQEEKNMAAATKDIGLLLDVCEDLNDSDDDLLMGACDDLEKTIDQKTNGENVNLDEDSDVTIISDDESPPSKKSKSNELLNISSVMDSPPRENVNVCEKLEKVENSVIREETGKNSLSSEIAVQNRTKVYKTTKKLPSWLTVKNTS